MDKIFEYLQYPSTWKGLIGLLAVFGIGVSPEQSEQIIIAAVAVVSAISTFFSDSDVKGK